MKSLARLISSLALAGVVSLTAGTLPAIAQERLCDTQLTDCRAAILTLIRNETQGLDVGFWYMADARFSNEIVKKFQAGLPVRVLMDDRADESKPTNTPTVQQLKDAGIPMRKKNGGGILHWKMMLFHGQNVVEFSKANFASEEFAPNQLGVDWNDEAIFTTRDDRLTNTFRTKFDNLWIDTSNYSNYANITSPLVRRYPIYPLDASLNLPPGQDFASRAVARYNQEQSGIDVLVFRANDNRHTDAMIAAVKRGVPVRVIHDPQQYREPLYWQDASNIDWMSMNGVQIKHRAHQGLMHEAAVIMHGLGEVIFGSSNWSPGSGNFQLEHNFFYTPSMNKVLDSGETFYEWFEDQFNRKWNNTSAFVPFQPLPPNAPAYSAPVNGTAGVPLTATLRWEGGYWAHKYDIYFGTTSTPPLIATDVKTGAPGPNVAETYSIPDLLPGTTYYWRVVGKTMADRTASGQTWSFQTAATGGGSATNVVMYAGRAPTVAGTWQVVSDATAAGGSRMYQPDMGAAKVASPSSSPANYFEIAFNVQAGVPYALWIRGKAQNDSYNNDSVWVQFSNSVDGSGTPLWRIGSTSGTWIGIEDCSGCGVQGWGWQDSGYGVGVMGAPVYFTTTGVQRIRVQQREDGISLDQIVLSPSTYMGRAPGGTKNDATILPEAGVASGPPPPPGIDEIVVHAQSVTTFAGTWKKESDTTAADGIRMHNADAGAAKLTTASASPGNYFEASFDVEAGKAYHLWLRMKADNNSYSNDSVFVQFTNSRDGTGTSAWRIGTTSALTVSLEEGSGAGVSGWGWNDNAYGSSGAPVYFATSGTQKIRIQVREDGMSIDQIVLSAAKNLTMSPGALKNDTKILPEVN